MSLRIIRIPKVLEKTGFGKSTIYQMSKDGRFPAQIKIGKRASGWLEEEVDDWIRKQVAASRGN